MSGAAVRVCNAPVYITNGLNMSRVGITTRPPLAIQAHEVLLYFSVRWVDMGSWRFPAL
jgi:hypothetical protein